MLSMRKKLALVTVLGIAVVSMLVATATADLVINGGFEGNYFSGWDVSDDGGFLGIYDGLPSFSGRYAAAFGAYEEFDVISQVIPTNSGKQYRFDFMLMNYGDIITDTDILNGFLVCWNGILVKDFTNLNVFGYTRYSVPVIATGASTIISFKGYNSNTFYLLDDVSVTPVPLPGAVWLLGSGLLGLLVLKLRSKGTRGQRTENG